jgi:hypothetical protein
VQEQHRLAMGSGLRLAGAEHPGARRLKTVAGGEDVVDLVADVVNAARGVLVEETLDRRVMAQRIKQFDLGVGQRDENDGNAVVRLVLRRADSGAQGVAVKGDRGIEVGHRDGHMVQASDHPCLPFTLRLVTLPLGGT